MCDEQAPSANSDAPPVPPVEPDADECCGEGCVNCVLDRYDAALERYRAELALWRQRRASSVRPEHRGLDLSTPAP